MSKKVPTAQLFITAQRGTTLMGFLLGIGFSLILAAIVAYFVYSKETPFKIDKNPNPPTASMPAAKAPEAKPAAETKPAPSSSASGAITSPADAPSAVAAAASSASAAATVPSPAAGVAAPEPVKAPAPVVASAAPAAPTKAGPAAESEKDKEGKPLFLQAGAFNNKSEAENRRAQLALMGLEGKITEITKDDKPMFRVRVGPFDSPENASRARGDMARNGIDSVLIK